MTVLVGTSGYDYPPWVGSFYPRGLPAKQRLSHYASRFRTVEINYSFYQKPTAAIVRAWAAQVPPEFRFALKAWQRITHHQRLRGTRPSVNAFAQVARALGPRLGPILYQLPPNLKPDPALLRDFLAQLPRDLPAAFEFRHPGWLAGPTFTALADAGAALCVADSEDLTAPLVRTAPFGYFRLRREEYSPAALARWAAGIQGAGFTADVHVYFRHEDTGTGPRFALRLLERFPAT